MSKIQVFADSDDPPQFRFHKRAANGEITVQSEGYTTKGSAIEAATREAQVGDVIEVLDDAGNVVNRYEVGEEAESE